MRPAPRYQAITDVHQGGLRCHSVIDTDDDSYVAEWVKSFHDAVFIAHVYNAADVLSSNAE